MKTIFATALAAASLSLSGPAFAQHGPGGIGGGMGGGIGNAGGMGGGLGGSMGGSMGGMGGISATGSTMRDIGRASSEGPSHASANATAHVNSNSVLSGSTGFTSSSSQARVRSQGSAHASTTAIAHANSHSVLSGTTRTSLTGLTTGTTLYSTSGAALGTVSRIQTNRQGTIVGVQLRTSSGQRVQIAPGSLMLNSSNQFVTSTTIRG